MLLTTSPGSAIQKAPEINLFEKGLKDSEKSPVFSSYGDPVFEKILNVVTSFELPGCIQRLTEPVPGTQAQVVAYAVASVENKGITGIRLITSWADLNSLVLDETIDLEGADLTGVKLRLQEMVRKEFEPIRPLLTDHTGDSSSGCSLSPG